MTLTFDLWPWTSAVYRLWHVESLYQIWPESINPPRSYCDFNIWSNDLERHVTYSAQLSGNFSQSLTFDNLSVPELQRFLCWCVISRCDLDFWPIDLESSWYIKRHVVGNVSEIEQSPAELLMISRFLHTLYRAVALTFDLLILNFYGTSPDFFKLCTKFEQNRIIRGWVTDDLARFRVQF